MTPTEAAAKLDGNLRGDCLRARGRARMIAKLAYLTSPKAGLYVLHVQLHNQVGTSEFEISEAHLANIIVDGASFALRKNHRVPEIQTENANERAASGA